MKKTQIMQSFIDDLQTILSPTSTSSSAVLFCIMNQNKRAATKEYFIYFSWVSQATKILFVQKTEEATKTKTKNKIVINNLFSALAKRKNRISYRSAECENREFCFNLECGVFLYALNFFFGFRQRKQ